MRAAFDVHGVPAPQGSKRAFIAGGRARVRESAGDKLVVWREAVRSEAQDQVQAGVHFDRDVPLQVSLEFRLPLPTSAPKLRRIWATKRPDLDKLARATLDALQQAGLYGDDAQVVWLCASKDYVLRDGAAVPGCWVRVLPTRAWEESQARLAAAGAA